MEGKNRVEVIDLEFMRDFGVRQAFRADLLVVK
jgi:hypothetical protein